MTLSAAQLAADAAGCNDFAESITYTPYGGTARTVTALYVDRNPGATREYAGATPMPAMVIGFPNSATLGITSSEINIGRDTITVAKRIGDTAVAYLIRGFVHDAGAVVVSLG